MQNEFLARNNNNKFSLIVQRDVIFSDIWDLGEIAPHNVLKQLFTGIKEARSLWTEFLDYLKSDADCWKNSSLEYVEDLMDTLKFTVLCIGNKASFFLNKLEFNLCVFES